MNYILDRDVNNFVNFLTGTIERAAVHAQRGQYFPVNLIEKKDSIEIMALVPGVKKEDISVKFESSGVLAISFKRVLPNLAEGEKWVRSEIGEFQGYRRFDFKNLIDETGVKAQSNDGVLTIHLPKRKADPEVTIQVL